MSNVSIQEIIGCVASTFSVRKLDLMEYRKHGRPRVDVSIARSAVVLLAYKHTMATPKILAEVFDRHCDENWRLYLRQAKAAAIDRSVNDETFMRRLEAAERMIDAIHDRRAEYPITDLSDDYRTEGLVA